MIHVRLSEAIHKKVHIRAVETDQTIQDWVFEAIRRDVERQERRARNMHNHNANLDINTLETWLWEDACVIRGPIDTSKFKDYILPLIFLKRMSDVFEDDLQQLGSTAK